MSTLPSNSSLVPYMGLLMRSNANPAFHRIVQAIIGSHSVQDTIDAQDIVHTAFSNINRFTVSPKLVAALQQTMEVFIDILTHAVHNVPFNTVATPLSIPQVQARQLQLTCIDNLDIAYLHYRSLNPVQASYASRDLLWEHLLLYVRFIIDDFVWMDERIQDSVCLGFDSVINWRVLGHRTWSEFLMHFYLDRVDAIAEEQGTTVPDLLEHYVSDDTNTVTTYIAPNNTVIPYNPNFPAFQGTTVFNYPPPSPSPPSTPTAFNDDLLLPPNAPESDFSFSDFSDSDSEMMDSSQSNATEDMDMTSADEEKPDPPDESNPFLDNVPRHHDDEDPDEASIMATYGGIKQEDDILDQNQTSTSEQMMEDIQEVSLVDKWITIVCYDDKGREMGRKSLNLAEFECADD
ncbi:hypothetical protein ARMGADRAFT_1030117 [Armillaria gallica]|uniref:Uncharacterized protein n=1 Tax=Armillaria gallica TaxID=47427 RepID=A0A2H3DH94_ARMGA|nr:hypothetical protein ARMGADRAFT_1030117 [Armillaria gallica]